MCADNRVDVDNRLAALDALAGRRGIDLLDTGMRGLEAVQTLLEERAQALIRRDGVDKERVAASLGLVEDIEKGGAGGLLLVGNVRVPGDGACAGLEEVPVGSVSLGAVHKVNLGIPFGGSRGRVDVVAAKVLAKLEGVGDGEVGKVLLAEGDNLALGDVAGELVLAGVVERGQLDAVDLGANGRGEVGDGGALGEEVGERGVGVLAVLVVLKGREGRVDDAAVPSGQVVRILGCVSTCDTVQVFDMSTTHSYLGGNEASLALLGFTVYVDRLDFLVLPQMQTVEVLGDGLGDGLCNGGCHCEVFCCFV